jgi:hypothetical protein
MSNYNSMVSLDPSSSLSQAPPLLHADHVNISSSI